MARQKGMLNLSGNLEPLAGAPLDSRSITPTVADLYIASNWPYKYIGMKTTVTATGDTYRLVNLDVTQESSWVKEGGESGQTIQYDELPAASSSLAGKIYQYTGTTNLQYTNGYFYECVNDGGTYKWVQTNTQPGSSYSDFTGATSQDAGTHGLVPAPTTGDISKFLKGDGTWATVPMPSFDYSNTSPEAMNFSTDEKVIGTWTDGKPLYQKTFITKTPTNVGTLFLSIGVSVDRASAINAIFNDGAGHWFSMETHSMADPSKLCRIAVFANNSLENPNKIRIDTTEALWINKDLYITLRYTKTTDSAVASGEKIVGQWIDGKPVYEKTFTLSNTTKGSEVSIDTSNLNISECAEIFGTYNRLVSNLTMTYMFNNFEGGVSPDLYYSMLRYDDTQKNIKYKIGLPGAGDATNKQVITIRYTKTTD